MYPYKIHITSYHKNLIDIVGQDDQKLMIKNV